MKTCIRVVMACTNSNGSPDLIVASVVDVTPSAIEAGDHYTSAYRKAMALGYEPPFVCFDENELPKALQMALEQNMIYCL